MSIPVSQNQPARDAYNPDSYATPEKDLQTVSTQTDADKNITLTFKEMIKEKEIPLAKPVEEKPPAKTMREKIAALWNKGVQIIDDINEIQFPAYNENKEKIFVITDEVELQMAQIENLNESFTQEVTELQKLRQQYKAAPADGKGSKAELKEILLRQEFKYQRHFLELTATRCDLLMKMRRYIENNPNPESKLMLGDLEKTYKTYSEQLKKITTQMRKIKQTILNLPKTVDSSRASAQIMRELLSKETKTEISSPYWKQSPLGKLLIPTGVKDGILYRLGKGFEAGIDSLKTQIVNVQIDINSRIEEWEKKLAENPDADVKEIIQDILTLSVLKNELKKALHQSFLMRLIDVRGEQENLKKERINSGSSIKLVDENIRLLKQAFDKKLETFTLLSRSTKQKKSDPALSTSKSELSELLGKKVYNMIMGTKKAPEEYLKRTEELSKKVKKNLSTLFVTQFKSGLNSLIWDTKFQKPEEIKRKFQYAEMGYNMREEVVNLLTNLYEFKSLEEGLQAEVKSFCEWADIHPTSASQLAGDILLSCSTLVGESAANQLFGQLRTRAFAGALLKETRNPDEFEPVESVKELRYKALADICRAAPLIVAATTGTAQFLSGPSWAPSEALKKIGGSLAIAAGIQTAVSRVPFNMTEAALSMAHSVRGTDYASIIAEKAKLESYKLTGAVTGSLLSPGRTLANVERKARIYFKSIAKAHRTTRVYRILGQVVLPALAVAAATTVVTLGILGIFFTLGISIPIAAGLLGGIWWLFTKGYENLNYYDPKSYLDAEKEVQENIKEREIKKLLQVKDRIKKSSSDEVNTILSAYHKTLPVLRFVEQIPPAYLNEVNRISNNLTEKKLKELNLALKNKETVNGEKLTIGQILEFFKSQISLEKTNPVGLENLIKNTRDDMISNSDLQGDKLEDLKQDLLDSILEKVYTSLVSQWLDDKIIERMAAQTIEAAVELEFNPDKEAEIRKKLKGEKQPFIADAVLDKNGIEAYIKRQTKEASILSGIATDQLEELLNNRSPYD